MHKILLAALLLFPVAGHADVYARLAEDGKVELRSTPAEGFELYMKSAEAREPAGRPDPASPAQRATTPFAKQVETAALAANVEPELLHAVMRVESNHRPDARSPAGAVGLMQLMPGTAKRYKVKDRLDPQQNLHGGAQYLRDLLDLYKNNLTLALAAYNAGEHAVLRYGNRIPPFSETRAYVPKVLAVYNKLIESSLGSAGPQAKAVSDLRAHLPQGRVRVTFAPGRSGTEPR